MQYSGLDDFLRRGKTALGKSPVAMIFAEDDIELDSTVRHHARLGFKPILVFYYEDWSPGEELAGLVHTIHYDPRDEEAVQQAVNKISKAAPGLWMYYCYNAEYLFFPFCETRTVGELLTFHTEERREAMLTYVIDAYAGDLQSHPNAVSLKNAFLDRSGYYSLVREDPNNDWQPKERQFDFFGGLRWRFEEHVPYEKRKIDRIGLFRAKRGVVLKEDHTFTDEEYNTYACPWHHNLTADIVSFRTAKALRSNPGSAARIQTFLWHNSVPFEWHSRQLLDLGLMEPGQWF